jgi:uncharacterized membrane protein
MLEAVFKWLRKLANQFIHGIAFVPAMMALGFVLLAMLAMELDQQGYGEALNNRVKWLTLKDAATASNIVSTVAAGIISLTVFSFSMTMLVMSQAASQMSNRILDNIIADTKQKVVLGFYVGTIIYSLFLLSNISEAEDAAHTPSLSVYILLALTVIDIFLFVYFLHYITQAIRYEQLIQRIHKRTLHSFRKVVYGQKHAVHSEGAVGEEGKLILSRETGYFQGFSAKRLLPFLERHNLVIRFLYPEGTYILKGTPFLLLQSQAQQSPAVLNRLFLDIDFYYGQEIDKNPHYGYQHLMEVGVKALSPGLNDPGTAVLSLNALTDILAEKMQHRVPSLLLDKQGQPRIQTKEYDFEQLFRFAVLPIWDYGKKDRLIQAAMEWMLELLSYLDKEKRHQPLFDALQKEVLQAKEDRTIS